MFLGLTRLRVDRSTLAGMFPSSLRPSKLLLLLFLILEASILMTAQTGPRQLRVSPSDQVCGRWQDSHPFAATVVYPL